MLDDDVIHASGLSITEPSRHWHDHNICDCCSSFTHDTVGHHAAISGLWVLPFTPIMHFRFAPYCVQLKKKQTFFQWQESSNVYMRGCSVVNWVYVDLFVRFPHLARFALPSLCFNGCTNKRSIIRSEALKGYFNNETKNWGVSLKTQLRQLLFTEWPCKLNFQFGLLYTTSIFIS